MCKHTCARAVTSSGGQGRGWVPGVFPLFSAPLDPRTRCFLCIVTLAATRTQAGVTATQAASQTCPPPGTQPRSPLAGQTVAPAAGRACWEGLTCGTCDHHRQGPCMGSSYLLRARASVHTLLFFCVISFNFHSCPWRSWKQLVLLSWGPPTPRTVIKFPFSCCSGIFPAAACKSRPLVCKRRVPPPGPAHLDRPGARPRLASLVRLWQGRRGSWGHGSGSGKQPTGVRETPRARLPYKNQDTAPKVPAQGGLVSKRLSHGSPCRRGH